MSTTELIERIDEVTTAICAQCADPLEDSPSDDFCNPECQQAWTAHQHAVRELTGYVEPWQRPGEFPGVGGEAARWRDGETVAVFRGLDLHIDTAALRSAMLAASEVFEVIRRAWSEMFERMPLGGIPAFSTSDRAALYRRRAAETHPPEPVARSRLDLSWLDYYVPALDDPVDHEAAAKRLFPDRPIRVPEGVLPGTAGPAVHADPRKNRR